MKVTEQIDAITMQNRSSSIFSSPKNIVNGNNVTNSMFFISHGWAMGGQIFSEVLWCGT